MNNQLAVKQSTLAELMDMAKMFFDSGMFQDTKSAAQAIVKIQAGAEMGIAPFAAMNGISIIMGKAVVGAGLIAGKIKGSGKYDYTVIQQDDKACSIDFYQGAKKIGNSTFTIDDAKKAGTKNLDKFPRNMLFARAISNGVKWFAPDVFTTSVYVPEEMIDIPHEDMTPNAPLPPAAPEPPAKVKFKKFEVALNKIKDGEANFIEDTEAKYEFTPEQWDAWCNEKVRVENEVANTKAQSNAPATT